MAKPTPELSASELAGRKILINGIEFPEASVLAMPNGKEIWEKGLIAAAALEGRKNKRFKIKRNVGDTDSLLGTTADGSQLAVAAMLVDIVALDEAKTFAEYKAAKLALMTQLVGKDRATGKAVNVADLSRDVLEKIKSGEILLTAVLKGVPAVLAETMSKSTQVVKIIAGRK